MDGTMARKHHKPEEVVAKLRQVDVLTDQGKQVERLKALELELENTWLRPVV